jgi:hypothetical protein
MFYCACIKINFVCILKRETRQTYLDIWKKNLLRKKYQASTAPQQPVVLPRHGQNSGVAKTNKASGRDMDCQFLLTFFFFATHTRIVVPQFQNSLVEMCHEAEVSSPSFINSLLA